MKKKVTLPLQQIQRNANGDLQSIEIWHKIKGKWVHCAQIDLDTANPKMYTDGVFENYII